MAPSAAAAAGRRDGEEMEEWTSGGGRAGFGRSVARDRFGINFYRNLRYVTVSTYVTVTLSLLFNCLPRLHFC